MTSIPKFATSAAAGPTTPAIGMDWRDAASVLGLPDRPFLVLGATRTAVGTTPTIVMDAGPALTEIVRTPLGGPPGAINVVSTSAADGADRIAVVDYIDPQGFYRRAFGALDGTTPIVPVEMTTGAAATGYRINHMLVLNVGDPDAANTGRVDARIGTDVQRSAPPLRGMGVGTMFMVPRGYICAISGMDVTVSGDDVTAALEVSQSLEEGSPPPAAFAQFGWISPTDGILCPDGAPQTSFRFNIPFSLTPMADVRIMAAAVSGTAIVSARVVAYLLRNNRDDPDPGSPDAQPTE